VIGEQVARHPSLAREMVSRGHELGLHGFAHLRQDKLTASQSLADLRRGLEEVETVAGARPRWYRPPYGRMSHGALSACRELRLDPVYWSSWGQDWEAVAAKTIAALACRDLGDGAIVLLHDSARYGQRASAAATAEAIGPIVDFARARGLALVTLSQALAKR